jgi:hypothetical protein
MYQHEHLGTCVRSCVLHPILTASTLGGISKLYYSLPSEIFEILVYNAARIMYCSFFGSA